MPASTATWSMPLKGVRLRYMHETNEAVVIGLETESKAVHCPSCGSASVVGYGKMTWRIRDLPVKKKPVILEILRRRLRCRDCLVTFNEPVSQVSENHRATTRLVQSVWKMALQLPFSALSKSIGMDEKTIRNIFQNTFDATSAQFNATSYPAAPAAISIHLTTILRRQRVMWINLDHGTLIDMNEKLTPDSIAATTLRMAMGDSTVIYVPPDGGLIQAMQATTQSTLRLHPASIRSACNDLIDVGRAINGASAYVDALLQFVHAKNAPEARRLWQDLISPLPGLRTAMRPLIGAVELLGPDCFSAFDQPDHSCDALTGQLDRILRTDFSKRSYDVICAIVLFDKSLQKTSRTGVANDGTHLGYQKANYGTSIQKLVAKLEKMRRIDE